jgi:hypothetical protein
MGRKAFRRLAVLIILAAAAYLAVTAGPTAVKTPPAAPPEQTPAAAPPAAPSGENQPAASGPRSGQMRLADAPDTFAPLRPEPADYTYTLKKERKERAIAPGVTYVPGEGIHIKTSGKDATIRITRDTTYQASDYQVMWHKKY